MLLNVEHISKTYGVNEGRVEALQDVEMMVEKGESIAIMGKSGSGKSTLLHIIGGVDTPTAGKVFFNDKLVNPSSEREMAAYRRKNTGFVFQDFKLLPELSVRDNIVLPLVIDKQKVDEEYVENLLAMLGLSEKKEKSIEELSGGQKQRVAIGRALIHNPDIILCDEPTGALDSVTSDEIMDLLERLNQQGKTIIIVTHDGKVASRCKKTIKISDGRLEN